MRFRGLGVSGLEGLGDSGLGFRVFGLDRWGHQGLGIAGLLDS